MPFTTKKSKIILLLLLLLVINAVVITLFFFSNQPKTKTFSVVLTKDGFQPETLTINKGDTVVFSTTAGRQFWPASNLHPSHDIYPAFDPQIPIEPDKTWSFTFAKEGTWQFHDHLAPYFTGKITVKGKTTQAKPTDISQSIALCSTVPNAQKPGCFDKTLEGILGDFGLDAAYDTFAKLYTTEPEFAKNCHSATHLIGEAAFARYKDNKDFPVNEKVSYCSFGFFHGFIVAMMEKDRSLTKAREFCDYMDKKLRGRTYAIQPCLHGIGHGITDGSDPKAYGDILGMISPGLDLCKKIGKTDYEVKMCDTGVFNSLANMLGKKQYGLPFDKNDPYWTCRQLKNISTAQACYEEFDTLVLDTENKDFVKAGKKIENVTDDGMAKVAMDSLSGYSVSLYLSKEDNRKIVQTCRQFQKRLQSPCISGVSAGFVMIGTPGKEYERALRICSLDSVSPDEKSNCYERVTAITNTKYPISKQATICNLIEEQYRGAYCMKVPNTTS